MSKRRLSVFFCDIESIFGKKNTSDIEQINDFIDNINMIREYYNQNDTFLYLCTNKKSERLSYEKILYLTNCVVSLNNALVASGTYDVICKGILFGNKFFTIEENFDRNNREVYGFSQDLMKSHFDLLRSKFSISLSLLISKNKYKSDELNDFLTIYPYEKVRIVDFVNKYNGKVLKKGGL